MDRERNPTMASPRAAADTAGVRDLLIDHGINPTAQRLEIAAILLARPQHLSAEQVLQQVSGAGGHVSKATVYNTLGLFAAKGLVRQVIVDAAKVFYASNVQPHHHFYDVTSGRLTDIEASEVLLQRLPDIPEGAVVEGVDVVVRLRTGD
jgi:Fur family iron response transcriptional regulator